MNFGKSVPHFVWLAAFAVPLALGECGGDSASVPDASARGDATGSASSGGSPADGQTTGLGSDGNTGATSDGSGSSGGQDAGTLCTALGVPPGCVQCLSNSNCPTAMSHCLGGTCVACASSSDCGSGTTPVCWPGNHTCHAACGEGGATCPTGMGQPSVCDTATGACVGCRTSMDCPSAAPVCDSTTMRCVQCQADNNCTGTTPHCDPSTSTCVACLTNADCTNPAMPVCRTSFGFMGMSRSCQAGCTSNAQCMDAGATVCDSTGNCVQCVDNSTCSGHDPVCDSTASFGRGGPNPTYHRCVVCLPPPFGSDAGTQGCDGGPGTCYYNMMLGGYVCR